MSRLKRVISNNSTASIRSNLPKENKKIPLYDAKGKAIRQGNEALKKKLSIFLFILSGIILFIYAPQIFMRDKQKNENSYRAEPDYTMMKICSDYYATHSSDDFDNDKLDNIAEDKFGCNPWSNDTDNDGVDDYYEVYISKTDPVVKNEDILINYQKELDKQSGKKVNSPYKMNNVVLWADDYKSKATGTVIETPKGYHFDNFTGYAQFPHSGNIYVYTNDNGKYKQLEKLKDEDAYKIDGFHNIEIYSEPLEETIEFEAFGSKHYLKPNWFSNTVAFILPSKGFLASSKKTVLEVTPDTEQIKMADDNNINYDSENGERFATDSTSLSNLQFVRSMIDNNKSVVVSLYSPANGEFRAIIYGYDDDNNLYVADETTFQYIGIIRCDAKAKRILTGNGEYALQSYFDWYGLGFNSQNYDRINFFSVSSQNNGMNTESVTIPKITEDSDNIASDGDAEPY